MKIERSVLIHLAALFLFFCYRLIPSCVNGRILGPTVNVEGTRFGPLRGGAYVIRVLNSIGPYFGGPYGRDTKKRAAYLMTKRME